AMVGVLLLCVGLLGAIRPRVPVAAAGVLSGVAGRLPEVSGVRAAVLALAGLAATVVAAVLASASASAYTVVLVGLIFCFAFAFTRVEGRAAVRILVVAVIVLSALRGALL